MDALLSVGQAGPTPTVIAELKRLLETHELVKLRYTGADRVVRAQHTEQILQLTGSEHVGSVGATALFFLRNPDPKRQQVVL